MADEYRRFLWPLTYARERMRLDSGGYHRDHLRALAQRVEVADDEVRIM